MITPGLSAFALYIKGFDIDASHMDAASAYQDDWGSARDERHHELDLGVKYLVPQGPAKDLSLYLVQQVHRASSEQFDGDFNWLRLYIEYPLDLL